MTRTTVHRRAAALAALLAAPEHEGENLLDMWPRPGDSPASQKSSYVRKAPLPDGRTAIVGAGSYLD